MHEDATDTQVPDERVVALTFDDGPGPHTRRLLDELAARSVRATFFLWGEHVAADPATVRATHEAGHALGNHSWSHPDLTTLSADEVGEQLDRTAAAIHAATGVTTHLFRPPFGAIDDQLLRLVGARGDAAILWDVDTRDWDHGDATATAAHALAGITPGSIVLMHDPLVSTVDAVPGIVDVLLAQGYTFVTVPELLGDALTPGGRYERR